MLLQNLLHRLQHQSGVFLHTCASKTCSRRRQNGSNLWMKVCLMSFTILLLQMLPSSNVARCWLLWKLLPSRLVALLLQSCTLFWSSSKRTLSPRKTMTSTCVKQHMRSYLLYGFRQCIPMRENRTGPPPQHFFLLVGGPGTGKSLVTNHCSDLLETFLPDKERSHRFHA